MIGSFEAVAEGGGVRCGVMDENEDEWLAATDVMPIAEARRVAARLQRAIHEAERLARDES